MAKHTSVDLSSGTEDQIRRLRERFGTKATVIALAVDRMTGQEFETAPRVVSLPPTDGAFTVTPEPEDPDWLQLSVAADGETASIHIRRAEIDALVAALLASK